MTKREFLQKISTIVVAENNKRGRPLFPSVVIAQAICESNWGLSKLMMNANAVFGIKCGSNWKGKYYNAKTKECYDGSNYVTIRDNFRAYDTLEESVKDYFDLICKSSRYRNTLVAETPLGCIQAIKNGGYATSPSYVTTIMSIIDSNNLTKYDNYKTENKTNSKYIIGKVYTTHVDLNVRVGAGTNYRKKNYNELSINAQSNAYKTGVLKKGTKVTCKKVIINNDEIWLEIPSGYVCAKYKGKEYIK